MNKMRYARINKNRIAGTLYTYRLLSHSLQDLNVIIKEFNSLTINKRVAIRKEHCEREELLKIQINHPDEDMYLTCTMVNFNVIAVKYDIDPATVCMCISPPCKINEKIWAV